MKESTNHYENMKQLMKSKTFCKVGLLNNINNGTDAIADTTDGDQCDTGGTH